MNLPSMPPTHTPTPRGQKRHDSPAVDRRTEPPPPPAPPGKKLRFRSAEEANTAFWDNLLKTPLCRSAVRELDRRHWLSVEPTTRSAGPITRSVRRRAAQVARHNQRHSVLEVGTAQLKRFARRGGPDLHHLRGYSEPSKASLIMALRELPVQTLPASDKVPKDTKMGTGSPAFENHLVQHRVYPRGYVGPGVPYPPPLPGNWETIREMLRQPRPSRSPLYFSVDTFSAYVRQIYECLTEKQVLRKPFSALHGNTHIPYGEELPFGNFAPLTDNTIVGLKPDYYEGAYPQQLRDDIRTYLSKYIVPSMNRSAPIVPNFFTEGKGPPGKLAVANCQACYDGAMGARGMQRLQSYGHSELVYDNNAYTITSTYDGEHLSLYTTHPTQPANPGDRPGYHMNLLDSWGLLGNQESFRAAITAYRNAREWAKEQRDSFIESANEKSPPQISSKRHRHGR